MSVVHVAFTNSKLVYHIDKEMFIQMLFQLLILTPVFFSTTNDEVREQFRKHCETKLKSHPMITRDTTYEYVTSVVLTETNQLDHRPTYFRVVMQPRKSRTISERGIVVESDGMPDPEPFYSGKVVANDKFSSKAIGNSQYWAGLEFRDGNAVATFTKNVSGNPFPLPFREFMGMNSIRSFLDVAGDKTVRFVDRAEHNIDGMPVVSFSFDCQNSRSDDIRFSVFFAKSDGRCLKWHYSLIDTPDEIACEATMEYSKVDGINVPKRCTTTNFLEDYQLQSLYRNFDFDSSTNSQEFFLSHYGLPEPDWYERPTPLWMYVSIAGMGFVLVGATVLYLGKKIARRR